MRHQGRTKSATTASSPPDPRCQQWLRQTDDVTYPSIPSTADQSLSAQCQCSIRQCGACLIMAPEPSHAAGRTAATRLSHLNLACMNFPSSALVAGESTIPSDFLAISEEYVREGQHDDGQKTQQRRCPGVTELLVHLVSKQWKCSCGHDQISITAEASAAICRTAGAWESRSD